MFYSTKRQKFLVDQGYAFKVITRLEGLTQMPGLVFPTRKEQIELLEGVLRQNESKAEINTDLREEKFNRGKRDREDGGGGLPSAKRSVGSMVGLSGGQHMSYVEQNKSVKSVKLPPLSSRESRMRCPDPSYPLLICSKSISKDANRNKLFKKRDQANKAFRKEQAKNADD